MYPNFLNRHIGRNIKRVREMQGIKQEALAKDLNLSQQTISAMEQSEEVDDERLQQVADALKVPKEFILNLPDDPAFVNHVSGTGNDIHQIYNQPIRTIHVYNQINHPLETVVQLYEKLLAQKDEIIAHQASEIEKLKSNHKKSA